MVRKILAGILGTILFVSLAVLSAIYGGWAFTILWGWFAVPLGLAPIGIAHALGLMLMVSYALMSLYVTAGEIRHVTVGAKEKSFKAVVIDAVAKIITANILVTTSLGFGWLYQLFM